MKYVKEMVRQLVYKAPHEIEIETRAALAPPRAGEAIVRTIWSGVSRGTERLVFEGRVPPSEYERMRAPFQEGAFPFPVVYGYAAVGVVEAAAGPEDAAWVGRRVFALAPHRTAFIASIDALTPLPPEVPGARATLAANMETALNCLWDGAAGPGDRIAVVGCGVVGALIGALAARLPGADVLIVDPEPSRRAVADAFGAAFSTAEAAPADYEADVVFHASATAAGLEAALALAGPEATVVEASWHGLGATPTPLGGAFHSRRLRLVSSQVGAVAPTRRPRWRHQRRLAKAVELLADPRYEAMALAEIAFDAAPAELPAFFGGGALGAALRYDGGAR